MRIYVDGHEETNGPFSATGINPGTGDLFIGNNPGVTLPFSGVIDEVAIYNVVLSASDILMRFNSPEMALPAIYYLGAIVDYQDSVNELNEGNNTALQIDGGGSPQGIVISP